MSKFSVRKPLTIFVAVLAVIILGVVAFTRMTPDLFPNMDFPYVMIMTTYPGQSPEIVEEEVTRPLEQSMATLEHIKELTSTSQENYSLLVLEFEESVNMDTIGVDIQQNISALQGTWDETVGTPYVLKINPSVLPIAIASVSKSDMDITELSDFLDETIVPKLEGVPGVASVSTSGSIYRQIHVVISQDKIDEVNRRMAEAVTGQMDDAQAELEDTKKELEDAKAELEKAQEELDSGKSALVGQSGSAQAALSEKQMEALQGRMQIQQQLVQMQETKSTLTDALTQMRQLRSGITELENRQAELEEQQAGLGDSERALAEAQTEAAELQGQVDVLTAEIAAREQRIAALEAMIAGDEPLPTGAPANTDEPTSTDAPANTDAPTNTDTPANTDAPTATDVPADTDTPMATDVPVNADTPADTEAPANTDVPANADTPADTDAPANTDVPANAETPTATDAPTATDVPDAPDVTALPSLPPMPTLPAVQQPDIPDLDVPDVDIPGLDVPDVDIPDLDIPDLDLSGTQDEVWLAQLQTQLAEAQAEQASARGRLAELQAQLVEAQAKVAELESQSDADSAEALRIQAELTAIEQTMAIIDSQLETLGTSRAEIDRQIEEMETNLDAVDAGIDQLNSALTQLDNGTIQLAEAMGMLSSGQSSGLLQLTDAAVQITVNSATLDSALEQVESGLSQLEDSRGEALAKADVSGSLTMSTVAQILGAQNFSMPAGYIQEDGISYMVSVGDKMTDQRELELLLLFDTGEDAIGPVYLEDVADVFVTDNSDEVYAKLNGADSVMLTFDKQSNAATAEVSDNLQARFDDLEAQYPGLKFVFLMDQGDYIYLIVNSIMESLFTGALFAILVLLLFLRDLRPTVITVVSIPVSVVFAFVLMYFSGVTLNMISLSGLAVAVGMLVDNSIVVIENIYRLRSKGATAVQAAVAGARQVAGAITSSTLTTVCVFLPIVFVEGITRQLFTDLALTMTYALMASLVIALTLVPAMAKGMLKDRKHVKRGRREKRAERGEGPIYRFYRAVAMWNLRHKWVTLLASVALLGVTAWAALQKGFSFMPEIDMNTVNVTISMPEGVERDEAVALADEALERISALPNAQYVGAMMGSSSVGSLTGGGGGGEYDVSVYVGLPEGDSGAEAGRWIADACAGMDCEVSYDSAMMDMSMLTGSGVAMNLYGENMEDLQTAAKDMAEMVAKVPGVAEVSNGLEDAQTAYHVTVDRNAAMKKGFTVAQLYMDLSTAMTNSATAMDMQMNSATADVIVETEGGMTLDDLRSYTFEQTTGEGEAEKFRLEDVARVEPTVSMATINRIDQRRYLALTASLEPGYNITRVTSDVQRAVENIRLPEGVSYEFTGENETIMDAVEDLLLMLLIGVILVYFIMVAQFQSLKSPFIVMFTIPLAFTGGFAALLAFGMDISIVSLIGFVMLVGIIVNNGIVLVDYVNQLRATGMARREALVEAGVTRMRPIFMTSLTTILGLIVMALGQNVGTSIMQPVAVVCIGGLLYATLMTLFVVPAIYDIMNRKEIEVISDEDMEYAEDDSLF